MKKKYSLQGFTGLYVPLLLTALLHSVVAFPQQIETSGENILRGEVKMRNNRPTIYVNEKPVNPLMYALVHRRFSWDDIVQENIEKFGRDADIKLIQVDLFLDDIWRPDGSITLDTTLRQLGGVLKVIPDAGIFIRLHVNAPRWWQARHPEESIDYGNTQATGKGVYEQTWMRDDLSNVSRFSLASEKWRASASDAVQRFCKELAGTREGNALIGIQVASGVYGEWHYFGFLENDPDLSRPMTDYFRGWLKKKYKTDNALRKAWGKGDVSLASAKVPGTEERNFTRFGVFRDPGTERNVIDYFEAQHAVVAEDILHFCKIVKESWPRPIITGSFYGYFYSMFTRDAAGGHLAIDTVLRSPYIDFLAGPQAYYPAPEATGDPYRSRGLLESVRLNGKLWLEEMDQKPPFFKEKDKNNYSKSVKESIALTRRNMMFTATKGMGMWFYDFGLPSGGAQRRVGTGFWNQPDVLEDIRKVKAVFDKNLERKHTSDADVLMVYDTRSFFALVSQTKKTNIANILVNWTALNTMKAGVVFDAAYLSDLDKVDLSRYKVVVFNNTFVVNPSERQFIREKVMQEGREVIWLYAPGYSDGEKLDVRLMSELIGINMVEASSTTLPAIKMAIPSGRPSTYDVRNPLTASSSSTVLPRYHFADHDSPYQPLFEVDDAAAVSLGIYESSNRPAIAKKELSASTAWYVGLPAYEPELMKQLLQDTKAHIFSTDDVVVYSGSGLMSVHTKHGGIKNITLKNGKLVQLNMDENSTFILDNETGEVILGNIELKTR